jgi:hypothetical protein
VGNVRTFVDTMIDDLLFSLKVLGSAIQRAFDEEATTPLHMILFKLVLDILVAELAVESQRLTWNSLERSALAVRTVHDSFGNLFSAPYSPLFNIPSAQELTTSVALLRWVSVLHTDNTVDVEEVSLKLG